MSVVTGQQNREKNLVVSLKAKEGIPREPQ